jgi:heme oxygenase
MLSQMSTKRVPTLHQRLRRETGELHSALEAAVDIETVIASRAAYVGHLQRLWRIHAALEAPLAAFDPALLGFDYRDRRRSLHLAADLAALHAPLPASPIPLTAASLEIATRDDALGCIYVVEGSSLGARAILPQIEHALGLTARHGASFFEGFGEAGKPLWRACLAQIDDLPTDGAAALRVVEAAKATFRVYMTELPQPAVPTGRAKVSSGGVG